MVVHPSNRTRRYIQRGWGGNTVHGRQQMSKSGDDKNIFKRRREIYSDDDMCSAGIEGLGIISTKYYNYQKTSNILQFI